MNYKSILAIVLFLPILGTAQDLLQEDTVSKPFNQLNFEIINIDTVVTHYSSGEYNNQDYKKIDSTKIWAYIILNDAPKVIDSIQLKIKVEAIMKENKINKANLFRDEDSIMLFKISSLYAANLLKERDGYLGQFNIE